MGRGAEFLVPGARVRPGAAVMVPQSAIELAKRFDGFGKRVKRGTEIAAVPYVCPAEFWTIGYGHLCAQDHPPITQDAAEAYLAQDLVKALSATLRYCPVLAAIVDFTFNLGAGRLQTSTLRRRINQQDWSSAALELRRWVYGGGKILPGLVTRRETSGSPVFGSPVRFVWYFPGF